MTSEPAPAPAIKTTTNKKMLVFSDLDGSLLDHDSYDWHPALPALEALAERGIPLVLVSSKTLAELDDYQRELGLDHPVVAENGAAIRIPDGYFQASASLESTPDRRAAIQSIYERIKADLGCDCEAFFELGVTGIVEATGLSEEQAALANERTGSEPVLWRDAAEKLEAFQDAVREHGLRCTRGGRFVHVMVDTNKAEAVGHLIDAYKGEWPGVEIMSVSLGDGPNDLAMLARTDVAVVIPGKHDHPMALESGNRVLRPDAFGPVGWNEAMQALLSEAENGE